MSDVLSILQQSYQVLTDFQADKTITILYLEAVAGIRFAMMEVANLLYSQLSNITVATPKSQQQQQLEIVLIQRAADVCSDPDFNTTDFAGVDAVGPAIYLLKLLVRLYGSPCLHQLLGEHPWLLPEGLQINDQVS